MGRIVYVHGQFVPEEEARIGLFDRGFLFGDAVYEVTAVIGGRMIDNDLHLDRLERSLRELAIPLGLSRKEIAGVQAELVTRNAWGAARSICRSRAARRIATFSIPTHWRRGSSDSRRRRR